MFLMAAFIVIIISIYIGNLSVAYPAIYLIYSYTMILGILAILIPVIGSGFFVILLTPFGLALGGWILVAIILLWLCSYAGFFVGRTLSKFLNSDQPN